MPEAGRDVQCSNCGHAWFQRPAEHQDQVENPVESPVTQESEAPPPQQEDAPASEVAPDQPAEDSNETPDAEENSTSESDEPAEDATAESHEGQNEDAGDAIAAMMRTQDGDQNEEQSSDETVEAEAEPEPVAHERQPLDEGVRDILREEAVREVEARSHDREQLETQDDLGLEDGPSAPDSRGVAAQERMARLRGLDVEDDTTASGNTGARRDLLPDIEEINSSLSPIGSEEVIDDFAEAPVKKGGFRRGFLTMIILAVIIIGLYSYAPLISESVPALAQYIEAFVAVIDNLRAWLDSMVQLALSKLQAGGE